MSETTELPPLTEAMTAKALGAHIRALEALMAPKGQVFSEARSGDARLTLYPIGLIGVSRADHPEANIAEATWPEAFAAARAWIANHATVHRDNRIRAMALAIIDLTDQHGECTRAMLTRRAFTGAEIDALKDAACQRASEMSALAPFEVKP